jgi:methylase of polypeptide subunit release factors
LLDFLIHGTSELKSSTLKDTPSFKLKEEYNIVLVANLPYIPEEMFEANVADNVKKREPKPAFV